MDADAGAQAAKAVVPECLGDDVQVCESGIGCVQVDWLDWMLGLDSFGGRIVDWLGEPAQLAVSCLMWIDVLDYFRRI